MAERKAIGKKKRFEVFKRDSFTCQYCGKSAPGVVLELDHIKPVSKGGNNGYLNLVTSCFDCNRGKRDNELSDDSVMVKQQKQLSDLNEKRQQMKMMIEWKKELTSLKNEQIEVLNDMFREATGYHFTESYKNGDVTKFIKVYGFPEVYDCLEIAISSYVKTDLDRGSTAVVNKLGGILYNRKHDRGFR